MKVESRDSVSLKPAELDELGQILQSVGLSFRDEDLDHQIELFPLVVMASDDSGLLAGFMFGSLERIGGTPAILWGLGAARKSRASAGVVKAMTGELARRAAISFPDEDVLVATRLAQPSLYALLCTYANVVPRPGYTANGEERAWGRRLAKRFGHESAYDDRTFRIKHGGRRPPCVPILDGQTIKSTGGAKAVSLVGQLEASRGEGLIAFGWAIAEDLEAGAFNAAC
jgi:hypothetical protein